MSRSLWLICVLIVSSCSANNAILPSETDQKISAYILRGLRLAEKGESKDAKENLNKALKLSGSIENIALEGVAALNLARIERLDKNYSEAFKMLSIPLENIDKLPLDTASEIFFEKAAIEIAEAKYSDASLSIDKGLSINNSENIGRYRNLKGKILFNLNRYDEADIEANKALIENKKSEDYGEVSNSLYLLATVLLQKGKNLDNGRKFVSEAIEIDKKAGDQKKLARDIKLLADIESAAGEKKRAEQALNRIDKINRNSGVR